MMLRSKKAIGDFIVLILVGIILFFMFAIINLIVRPVNPDDIHFNEYYTKDLVRFLRTPGSVISDEYDEINVAEYISLKFELGYDQTFDFFSRDFAELFCARYSGSNDGCYLGVAGLSCLEEARSHIPRAGSTETRESREQRCITYYPGALSRLPMTLKGYDVVSRVTFNGPSMEQYELRMVVQSE